MNGISSILIDLQNPAKMKITVETLGFQHLDLDVTVPRVIIFRDAILDLLEAELGSRFSTAVRNGLSQVLSWVGGAYIYIRRFSIKWETQKTIAIKKVVQTVSNST